ncbi:MAG: ADP-ribosylglycohydrolase family protein [Dethiosulfatibacter sp.]|nr:ADP-ribosylglycohydrolase family protein [Dethiosulfatibacter sp.]
MIIPQYIQDIYASWLGKLIGIRLGAPVENWSSDEINKAFGSIEDFVVRYPIFGADDDSNGPLYFTRVFDDTGKYDVSTKDMGNTMLNVIPKGHGFFWWGGVGVSTEHTMYHHLSSGIPAEESGLRSLNGQRLSEQIGGQIFSDGWAYIAYKNTPQAVKWAAQCAKISHDGEGVEGARFVSAAISIAFSETDILEVIQKAKAFVSRDSQYGHLIDDIVQYYKTEPNNPDKCLQYIKFRYPYSRYGGICPIIPNAAVMLMAMCYGKNSFRDTLLLCINAGYDTDCNGGNVGSIMGALLSIQGLHNPWVEEINDTAIASGLLGSVNMTDVMTQSLYFAKHACHFNGLEEHPGLYQSKAHFNFLLPASTQGFIIDPDSKVEGTLRNVRDMQAGYRRALQVNIHHVFPGEELKVLKYTYLRASQIYDARYEPALAPIVWPNQWIRTRITSESEKQFEACLVAVDILGKEIASPWLLLDRHYQEIQMQIPAEFHYVHYVGVKIKSIERGLLSFIKIDEVLIDGEIEASFDFTSMPIENYGMTFSGGIHKEIAGCTHMEGDWKITKAGCTCDFQEVGHLLWGDVDFQINWVECLLKQWEVGSEVHIFKRGAKRYTAIQRSGLDEITIYDKNIEITTLQSFKIYGANWDNIILRINCSSNIIRVIINGQSFSVTRSSEQTKGCLGFYKPQNSRLTLNQIKISSC